MTPATFSTGTASPTCQTRPMAVRRIMPYHESPDFEATRAFYTRVLGLQEGTFGGGYIGFGSGQAQVLFAPPGSEPVLPDMGVDVASVERDAEVRGSTTLAGELEWNDDPSRGSHRGRDIEGEARGRG